MGGIEYLEAQDGRLIFYDINANSNLRPSIAQSFGFDPFERVADFLLHEMRAAAGLKIHRPAAAGDPEPAPFGARRDAATARCARTPRNPGPGCAAQHPGRIF